MNELLTAVPAHAGPIGWNVGAPIAIQTASGVLAGRIEEAVFEQQHWTPFGDFLNGGADGDGPGRAERAAMTRPFAGLYRPTSTFPRGGPRRVDLKLRIDGGDLGDGIGAGGNPVARHVRNRELAAAADAALRTVTQQGEQDVMGIMTNATPGAAAWSSAAAWSGTSADTYATTTTAAVTTGELVAAMIAWKDKWPAPRPTSPAMWFSAASGDVYSVAATNWAWDTSASTGVECRFTVDYGPSEWALASVADWSAPPSPAERFREAVRDRMVPATARRRNPHTDPVRPGLASTDDFRELRARETLARVIGEDRFRRFLRDGFVTVRAKSGRSYQIYPGGKFTKVYFQGKEEPQLCVVLKGKFPPTDSLIVRFLMLMNDEPGFRALAVNQGVTTRTPLPARDHRPLVDVMRDLKFGRGRYNRRETTGVSAGREMTAVVA